MDREQSQITVLSVTYDLIVLDDQVPTATAPKGSDGIPSENPTTVGERGFAGGSAQLQNGRVARVPLERGTTAKEQEYERSEKPRG